MSVNFTGRRVVVCGGSRGIGRSIALGFAQAGADVSICAREPKALEETRAEIARSNHKAHAASCDLGDAAAIKRYIEDAAKVIISAGMVNPETQATLREIAARARNGKRPANGAPPPVRIAAPPPAA